MRWRYILSVAAAMAWGLWFGGLMTLFLLITALFRTFSGQLDVFDQAGRAVFRRFEPYQLILAAAALLVSVLSAWVQGLTRPRLILLVLFILATIGAIVESTWLTPEIERLVAAGATHGADFRRAHGGSMMIYAAEAVFLFLAGLSLVWDLRGEQWG